MIVVTERAKQRIKEMLAAKTSNPDVGMRLVLKPNTGKFVLRFDKERERDQVVRYNGSSILLIDEIMAAHRGMLTIDLAGAGAFRRLVIAAR